MYNMSYMMRESEQTLHWCHSSVSSERLRFIDGEEVKAAGVTILGIRDQRLALQWVRENLGAFGGDTSKVRST